MIRAVRGERDSVAIGRPPGPAVEPPGCNERLFGFLGGRGGWKSTYNHTFIGWIGKGKPRLVIAVTIREAQPLVIRQGFVPLAVESYELFRRIATDAISTLDLSTLPPTNRPPAAPAASPSSNPSTAYP